MERLRLRAAGRSERGPVRSWNEDDYRFSAEHELVVLCDGMGGNCGGVPASKTAVWATLERFQVGDPPGWDPGDEDPAATRLREAIERADQRVQRVNAVLPANGATIAALHLDSARERVTVAHVGDCRVVRWRDGQLARVTEDHSLIRALRAAGRAPTPAQLQAYGNIVTRALGFDERFAAAELHGAAAVEGDMYLLTTDGLHDALADEDFESILRRHARDLQRCVDLLIARSLARGSDDNATICAVELTRDPAPRRDHGRSSPPTLPWLYSPDGPAPEAPERWRRRADTAEGWSEFYRLVVGDDDDRQR